MDLGATTTWWIAAGLLVAAELATGTFYLLMLALGAAAAALAALAGLALPGQLVAGAVVGGGAVALWRARRARGPKAEPPSRNRDVNLDIGQRVHVDAWQPDGTARVHYRGAAWSARYAGAGEPAAGDHVIRAVDGSELQLAPALHPH